MKIDAITTYFNTLTGQLATWFLGNPKKKPKPIDANSQFSNGSVNTSSLHSILPNSSAAPVVYPLNDKNVSHNNSSTAPFVCPLNDTNVSHNNSSTAPFVYPSNDTNVSHNNSSTAPFVCPSNDTNVSHNNSSTAPFVCPSNDTNVSHNNSSTAPFVCPSNDTNVSHNNSSTAPVVYPSNDTNVSHNNSSTAPVVYPSNDTNVSHNNSSTAPVVYPSNDTNVSHNNSSTIPSISHLNTSRVFTPDQFKPFNPSSSSGFNSTLVSLNSEDRSSAGSSNHTSLLSSMAGSCSSLESNPEQETCKSKVFYQKLGQKLQKLVVDSNRNHLKGDATNSFICSNILQPEGLLGSCASNNLIG